MTAFEELLSVSIPLVAVGTLLATVGQGISLALGKSRKGWRGLWHRTRALHPIAAGLVLGCTSLPVPEDMGGGLAGKLVWYGMAGGLAVPIYEMVQRAIDRKYR